MMARRSLRSGTPKKLVPCSARRADALGLVAESFLAHGAIDAAGGDRHQVVVHVAAETLLGRKAGCCTKAASAS